MSARYPVLGVPVSVLTMDSAIAQIEDWARDEEGRFVCIRDVASLMAIRDDPALAPLHRDAAMITPDGMPLVAIGKLRGLPVERVCGPDLIVEMMKRSGQAALSHYFYGGREGVAAEMARRFSERFPDVRIAGWESPPFGELSEEQNEAALERLRASGADVVWIGISSPRQDAWMWRNYKRLPQTLIGVGAAFDFHSGQVARAPRWMQKSGLEWAYRLGSEPRRLWRRYLVQAPRFVALAAAESLKRDG